MKFDLKKIEKLLNIFWKENRTKLRYFLSGKEVFPKEVSSCTFQLEEGDYLGGNNFKVSILELQVWIDSMESQYKGDFLMKVVSSTSSDSDLPHEKIIGIYNDRINLRK